jgi:hypothetical protein
VRTGLGRALLALTAFALIGSIGPASALAVVRSAPKPARAACVVDADAAPSGDLVGPPSYVYLRSVLVRLSRRNVELEATVGGTLPSDHADLEVPSGSPVDPFAVGFEWRVLLGKSHGQNRVLIFNASGPTGHNTQWRLEVIDLTRSKKSDYTIPNAQITVTPADGAASVLHVRWPRRATSTRLPSRFRWTSGIGVTFLPNINPEVNPPGTHPMSATVDCPKQPDDAAKREPETVAFPNRVSTVPRLRPESTPPPRSGGAAANCTETALRQTIDAQPPFDAFGSYTLSDIRCAGDYATVSFATPQIQGFGLLFKYSGDRWSLLNENYNDLLCWPDVSKYGITQDMWSALGGDDAGC